MEKPKKVVKKNVPGSNSKTFSESKKESPSERISKGQIQGRIIVEMMGKPADYVQKLLEDYMKVLKEDDRFIVESMEFEKPSKDDDGMYSTFCETVLWAKKIENLVELCIDYMPSSVEILSPETLRLASSRFSAFLNDMQAKLHQLDMVAKTLDKQNQNLRNNASQLVKNIVMVILRDGAHSIQEVAKLSGIKKDDLPAVLKPLEKKGIIKREGDQILKVK